MNAVDIVILCENSLGFTPQMTTKGGAPIPLYKARSTEAAKLKNAIAKDPRLFTMRNLQLTIEYLRRQRKPIESPVVLTYFVEEALEHANAPVTVIEVAERINAAVAWEMEHELPDSDLWVGRLIRSAGDGRETTLNDWKEAGRGV